MQLITTKIREFNLKTKAKLLHRKQEKIKELLISEESFRLGYNKVAIDLNISPKNIKEIENSNKLKNRSNNENYIGRKFNFLTIIGVIKPETKQSANFICQCDCGNIKTIRASSILRNVTKACGCRKGIR